MNAGRLDTARMSSTTVNEAISSALEHEKNQRFEEAESVYRELVSASPGEAVFHEKLMETLFRQRRMDDMYSAYKRFAEMQADGIDAEFESIYLQAMRVTSSRPWPLQRRARFHALIQLLAETKAIEGEIAECGCYLGLSSYLMCSYLRKWHAEFRGAQYHIFDSFQGLSAPTTDDAVADEFPEAKRLRSMCVEGAFAASLEQVRSNLAAFPDIAFHPGWIPLSFQKLPERAYRFVHVDVDLYDPTIESFEYFYPRLATGGIIVSDDYDWPGARLALAEFCDVRGLKLGLTPHNQAFVRRAG